MAWKTSTSASALPTMTRTSRVPLTPGFSHVSEKERSGLSQDRLRGEHPVGVQ